MITKLKSQFTSWLLYNAIDYAYNNPDKLKLNVLYFSLEESDLDLAGRYSSYLLKKLTNGQWRYSPAELNMSNNILLSKEVDDFIHNNEEFKKRCAFFDSVYNVMQSQNPTGILKDIDDFMYSRGEVKKVQYIVKNEDGQNETREKRVGYIPKHDNEFNIVIVDHVSRVGNEKGEGLRESIARLSKDLYKKKLFYGITPILVQQQALSIDIGKISVVKDADIKASVINLGDCKTTAQDFNVLIGISDPNRYNKYDFNGFDIRKLGDYYRYGEILLNRNSGQNIEFNLFFDGKCCDYELLPNSRDVNFNRKMEVFYDKIRLYNKKN